MLAIRQRMRRNLMKTLRLGSGLAISLILTACSGLIDLPGSDDAPQVYQLTAPSDFENVYEKTKWRILVDEPDASRSIDTDKIALRPSEIELSYYAKARWGDRAPRLVQNLVIESLENAGAFEFAGRGPSGMNAQYLLNGTLASFHTNYADGDPIVSVSLRLNLIDQRTGNILESGVFASQIEADRNQVKAVVLAFNEAAQDVMRQAVDWTYASLEKL